MPISEQEDWGGAEPWTGSLIRLRSSWHGLPGLWEWTQTPAEVRPLSQKKRLESSFLLWQVTHASCLWPFDSL